MNDNDIIKAFEHLVKNANNHIPITGKMLLEDVVGVLNRQKAENEGKADRIRALNDTNKILMETQEVYAKNMIKEFAERLKEDLMSESVNGDICDTIACICIDNLVKEMTEVSK